MIFTTACADPRKRFDPTPRRRVTGPGPRMTVLGVDDWQPYIPPPEPRYDDPLPAKRLGQRLQVLQRVLDDLPKYAKRLARAEARRATLPPGPKRVGSRRGGWPPGHRIRGRLAVDEVLRNCDSLAVLAMKPPI